MGGGHGRIGIVQRNVIDSRLSGRKKDDAVPPKVLIVRWDGSSYDVLGGLLRFLGQELTGLGCEVDIVSVEGIVDAMRDRVAEGGYAFAVTMSGIGSDIRCSDGRLLWEAVGVPLFNWNCDHPCHFPARHAIRDPFLLHGYVFPDHGQYAIDHFNPNGAAFAVHIGMPPRSSFAGAPLPASARNGRIVFSKSGADPNALEASWHTYPPVRRAILFEATEALFLRTTADYPETIARAAERHGLLLSPNSNMMMMYIRDIDHYVRTRRSDMTMRTLMQYPIDLYGHGWAHLPWDGATARYHGPIGWDAMLGMLPHYLGALSLNPLVDRSLHDRVFFAIAAGVVPLSDRNAFSRQHAPALEPYAFDFTPERIKRAADSLLSNPGSALDRTEATYQSMAGTFTMRVAAERIVEFSRTYPVNARTAF